MANSNLNTTDTFRASDFISSIGINTHGGAFIDGYQNSSLILNSLSYLGITSVRDAYAEYGKASPILDAMASAGIKFDFTVSYTLPAKGEAGIEGYLNALKAFIAEHPGSVVSIEGINEANINDFSYNGSSSVEAAAQFQRDLYTAVKADAALNGVAVLNMTIAYDSLDAYKAIGDLGAYSDYANAHAYPHTGHTTDAAMEATLALAQGASQGDPLVITETGYTTLSSVDGIGASETAQAKLILTNLLNAYEDGSQKTYLYELMDTSTSAIRGEKEAHFGLFNEDGTPKLAATALHNFTTILAFGDDGSSTATTAPTYSVSNASDDTHSMLMAKSGGVYDIVVWADKIVWNDATDTDIVTAPVNVTVELGRTESIIRVYDPLQGLDPIAVYENVSSITIPLSDHALIIEVGAAEAVHETVTTVSPDLTMTAAELVAQIDKLAASSGLESVTLTDSHTLNVSTTATMNYMIAHYGSVLSKIAGGYEFSTAYGEATWQKVQTFDASGKMTSETDYGLQDGVIVSKTVLHTDGSYDYYAYGITGRTYTTEQQTIDASGKLVSLIRSHADGTLDSTQTNAADGSKHFVYYDATGHKLNDVTVSADGVNTTLTYNPTTGLLVREMVAAADGSVSTTTYTGAVKTGTEVIFKSGAKETMTYDTAGKLLTDAMKHADGSMVTKIYTNGVLTARYEHHADGSYDNYSYGVTGQSYTSIHQVIDTKGNVVSIIRTHADGSLDYTQVTKDDGSKQYVYYDATGHKLNDVVVAVDGARTTLTYNATTGVLTRQIVAAANGDVTTTNYTSGIKTGVEVVFKSGAKETMTYDTAGKMLTDVTKSVDGSTVTKMYTNSVLTARYEHHADGTYDNYSYGVTGQTYTSVHQTIDAKGNVTALVRTHADGSLDYTQVTKADGSKQYVYYDATGHKLNDVVVAVDGARTTLTYNATTGVLTRQIVAAANGDVTTTNYTSGIKTGVEVVFKSGAKETMTYDTAGKMLTDVTKSVDGGTVTKVYTNSVLTARYEHHADGTYDNYSYGVTGQTYTSVHQVIDAKGNVVSIIRSHADGSLDSSQVTKTDGSKQYVYYDATGHKLNDVVVAVDGARTTLTYNATTGVLTRQIVAAANGDVTTTNYTSGIKSGVEVVFKSGIKETMTYDTAGKMLTDVTKSLDGSTVTKVYTNSVLTARYEHHADGTYDNYSYGVTGQTYTTIHQVIDAKGNVTALIRSHADGSLDSTQFNKADGSKQYVYYDATGHKLNDVVVAADGARTTLTYNATTGLLTRQIVAAANGDVTTTNYTSGIKSGVEVAFKSGAKETLTYDAAGKLLTDATKAIDGGTITKVYKNDVLTSVYDRHADGSSVNTIYGVIGQTYVTEQQTLDTKGNLVSLIRSHADGSLDSTQTVSTDGEKHYVYYDATGHKLNDVTVTAAGDNTTLTYSATTGLLVRTMVSLANGDVSTTTYTGSVKTGTELVFHSGAKETQTFDATTGKMLTDYLKNVDGSTVMNVYKGDALSAIYQVHADGSKDNYTYGITGQTYVTEHQTLDAAGKVTQIVRSHADGSLDYTQTNAADGDKHYVYYDATGHKTNDIDVTAAGVRTTLTFDAASGKMTQEYIEGTGGSIDSKIWSDGVLMKETHKHADGTTDYTAYNLSGSTYTTQHQLTAANGTVLALERYHADGTLDYAETRASDGTRDLLTYNSTGTLLNHVTIDPTGARVVENYLQNGTGDIREDVYNKSLVLLTSDTIHTNGTHSVTAYVDSQTLRGGAADDAFSLRTTADGNIIFDGGHDTITTFNASAASANHITIDHTLANTFSDLHMAQSGSNVVITFDDHNSIQINQISVENVKADFFIFA